MTTNKEPEKKKAEKVALERLVNADQMLETLFEPESRPTRRTVWNWVREGHIPCVRIGVSVFFDPVKVRAWFEKKRPVFPGRKQKIKPKITEDRS